MNFKTFTFLVISFILIGALSFDTPVVFAVTSIGTNISTNGTLTADGALKFTSGASVNLILKTDALGNATWVSITTALSNAGIGIGAANGIAQLDGSSQVPLVNLPAGTPGGLATLDGTGKITISQLPSITISNTFVVADEAAMLALTAGVGDIAIRTDENKTYILAATPATTLSNWLEIVTPLDTALKISSNLSDLSDVTAARTNLGLGTANSPVFTGLTLSGGSLGINGVSYLFPSSDGASGQVLTTDGLGGVSWSSATGIGETNTASNVGVGGVGVFDTKIGVDLQFKNINASSSKISIADNIANKTVDVDVNEANFSLNNIGGILAETKGGTNQSTYTVGDTLFASATDILSRLAIGSSGQVLTVVGGLPTWATSSGSGGSSVLSSLAAATTTNTINNGDNTQVWNWSLNTIDNTGINFGENIASTATGSPTIVKISTQSSSTAIPLSIKNLGDGNSFRVDDQAGDTTPFLIDDSGNLAIGSDFFAPGLLKEKLKVEGDFGYPSIITANGDLNSGLFITVKNRNSGNSGLSAMVQAADNFSQTPTPVNLLITGITSSGYANASNTILGANEAFMASYGNGLTIGTAIPTMPLKFVTGGSLIVNERMRIDGTGNIGINTTTPGSKLDVKGEIRLSGATSGYVGFISPAIASSTTYILPTMDGSSSNALITDGAGNLSWSSAVLAKFQRIGTTLSPTNPGEDITTSGDIYTTATGTITSAGLLTGNSGLIAKGADINLNAGSNYNTNINTGTSTGAISIGNSLAGQISIQSALNLILQDGASTLMTQGSNLVLQPSGTGTTSSVQIGIGGAGSVTPDLLNLDVKSNSGDPISGVDGSMYYNESINRFRCFINGSWSDCDTTGGTVALQNAYNSGATITTSSSTDIGLILTSGNLTASGAGSVLFTPTGASSFTSGGALTFTGGATSTWGTSAGDLNLQVGGTGSTASVKVGSGVGSITPDLFSLDVKSSSGDPLGYNGAMYYNANSQTFRCYENSGWKDCGSTGAGADTLQQTYESGSVITTSSSTDLVFNLTSGNFITTGAGSVLFTPTGASSFTSGGALTFTGGAASTWSTNSGALTVDSAAALNLGTTNATSILIGKTGITTTNNGALTSTGHLTASNGLTLSSGALNVTATSGALTLSGLSASSINTGSNSLVFVGSPIHINTTGSGVTNIGSATSLINFSGLTASAVLFTDSSKNLTSTGTVTIAQGGTGQVTHTLAFNALSPLTTKGDLIVHDGTNNTRLSVGGINGQVLTIDSTQAAGIRWETPIATGVTTLNGLTDAVQTFVTGITGTDFNISSVTGIHTFNIPNSASTSRGLLSSTDWITFNSKQAAGNYITALTGDITASGPGSAVATLANTAVTTGSYGSASAVATFTVDSKGRLTAAASTSIAIDAAAITSGTLPIGRGGTGATSAGTARSNLSAAASGANSDITSLSGLTTALSIAQGGTGSTTKTTSFNALSPLTTKGDLISYDGTNNLRVAVGSNGQVLVASSTAASGLVWSTLGGTGTVTSVGVSGANGIGVSGSPITTSGTITLSLGAITPTSIAVNGGTIITKHLSATSSLNIASIAQNGACNNTTMTVTGAATGDTVVATPLPVASGIETLVLSWNAYVSAVDTVTVRACNFTAGAKDPAAQTWRADVWEH